MKMLVLSRKKHESIVVRDDITIVVVEIRGDKVRLGIEAPKEVPVHRREVFDAIHRVRRQRSPGRPSMVIDWTRPAFAADTGRRASLTLRAAAAFSKTAAARMVNPTKLTAGKDQPCSLTIEAAAMVRSSPITSRDGEEDKTPPPPCSDDGGYVGRHVPTSFQALLL